MKVYKKINIIQRIGKLDTVIIAHVVIPSALLFLT